MIDPICYLHYFISKDPRRSDQIFQHLIKSINESSLIRRLQEIKVITCGNKSNIITNFNNFEKVNIVSHVEDPYCFEFPAIEKIFQDCSNFNDNVPILYLHLKGASKPFNKNDLNWTDDMLTLVRKYENCLQLLEKYDAIGTRLEQSVVIDSKVCRHFSGNFFWTKSSYVKSLPNPEKESLLKTHGYMIKSRVNKNNYAPTWCNHRYLCEFWIGMNNLEKEKHNLFDLNKES